MDDFEHRLGHALQTVIPEPPVDIDPEQVTRIPLRRRRPPILLPLAAALAVAAITVGAFAIVGHHLAPHNPAPHHLAPHRPASRPAATMELPPAPPGGYQADEFRLAAPGVNEYMPPPELPRATCRPSQITATAATRRTTGGVLGVVRLRGTVIGHDHGNALRCSLPVSRGPAALLAADGRTLTVPLAKDGATTLSSNPDADIWINNGSAIWGFAWFGSYCGDQAQTLKIPLDLSGTTRSLLVPLHGPAPECNGTSNSTLVDGIAGAVGEPVQPPPPGYADLRVSGHIDGGTTDYQIAPMAITVTNTGTDPVTLDPCPAYAGNDEGASRSNGGFGGPLASGYLPCTKRAPVIRPGQSLRHTIPANYLDYPAVSGSSIDVILGFGGLGTLTLKTTAP